MLVRAKSLVNSFHVTVRTPPEVLGMICSHLTEEGLFSASQVCQYWRTALISTPSLWSRVSCGRQPPARTTASLQRSGPLPIRLQIKPPFPAAALEDVQACKNKIVSLTIHHKYTKGFPLHQLLPPSMPHLERLCICVPSFWVCEFQEQTPREVWQGLKSLRELLVYRYSLPIDQFTAPNLVHLALHSPGYRQNVTLRIILDMLHQCPLLETLFISYSNILPPAAPRDHPTACLPYLRNLELGAYELRSGLIAHLDFPKNITAGFWAMSQSDVCGDIPPSVKAAVECVLGRIDIYCITLATHRLSRQESEHFLRFEGPQGSLEIHVRITDPAELPDIFGQQGVLFSHKPRIEEVRELQIVGCYIHNSRASYLLNLAMPNVVSISFFGCNGLHMRGLLAPPRPISLPFPHLERVMVLGSEQGLEDMARRRKDLGAQLKSLVIGRALTEFEYNKLEDYTALEGLVDNLWVGCPTQIFEWLATNEIANVWSMVMTPTEVSTGGNLATWT